MSELTTKDALLERAVAALEKIKTVIGEINPAGVIQAFAGSTTPDGWLLCDGSAVSRTTYADLFAAIGTTYGEGDGSTTFNVPDLTDKFIEGSETSGTEKSAGLPNITGTTTDWSGPSEAGIAYRGWVRVNAKGAFATNSKKGERFLSGLNTVQENYDFLYNESFDASRCSSVYGNSDTVQPPALTMRYIIKY